MTARSDSRAGWGRTVRRFLDRGRLLAGRPGEPLDASIKRELVELS